MTEKDKKPLEQETESILEFEDAKEMTIGQANRKAEEIEAGVTEGDNVLDKYIKQHRAEIEAEKYDTKILAKEELAKAEELAATETVAEVAEAVENKGLKWMLSQLNYLLRLNLVPHQLNQL